MAVADMKQAHQAFPEIIDLADELRGALPPPSKGFHSRSFENGKVTLLLLIGDTYEMLSQLVGCVDAWFLDGFAPAKNPDMWSDAVFQQIARLSKPGSTLATFTAAGFVRRGLTDVGFKMSKTAGFARKRERLVGEYTDHETPAISPEPAWAAVPHCLTGKSVGIVGGGIAGAALSHELKKKGFIPTIVSAPNKYGCSGIPAAILAPRFVLEESAEQGFFASAFAFSVLEASKADALASNLGVFYPSNSEAELARYKKIEKTYGWGTDWLELEEAGLHLPTGGSADTAKWVANLTNDIRVIEETVTRVEQKSERWVLFDEEDTEIATFDQVILAAGAHTGSVLKNSNLDYDIDGAPFPEVRFLGGQIECVLSDHLTALDPRTQNYGNYVSAPLEQSDRSFRTLGSTFEKLTELRDFEPNSASSRFKILDDFTKQFDLSIGDADCLKSWSGVRATTPDHLPYAGPLPNWTDLANACAPLAKDARNHPTHKPAVRSGLYILTGLGSKGFQYGPLLANYLAALVAGDPLPIPANMIAKLHPGRGLVRSIIKQNK